MDNFSSNACLNCGKGLAGRMDKKFCDAYCRNSYNNQHKSEDERYIKEINVILRKNRRILKTLCPIGKATVRKEVLDEMGYNYQFFNSLFKTDTALYYLVYDYGIAPIKEKGVPKALIVQRQSYMDELGFEIWKK
ncbi:hypothetical protein [Ekhidna sp.]